MIKVRLFIAVSLFIILTLISIHLCITQSIFFGLSLFLSAFFFTGVILSLFSFDSDIAKFILGLASILSFIGIYTTNDLFRDNNINNNINLTVKAAEIRYCTSNEQENKEKRDLFNSQKDNLLLLCVTQNHRDLMKFTFDSAKVIHLDPISGLIDTIYGEFNSNHRMTCSEMTSYLNQLCPGIFSNS